MSLFSLKLKRDLLRQIVSKMCQGDPGTASEDGYRSARLKSLRRAQANAVIGRFEHTQGA